METRVKQDPVATVVRRIEAALARIEDAGAALNASQGASGRDRRLRERVAQSLSELDQLIDELER